MQRKTASSMGEALAVGAGGGAVLGALTSLLDGKPTLRKALQHALIGGVGGAAIGGGVKAVGGRDFVVAPPVADAPPTPPAKDDQRMSLTLAAFSGLVPGIGPALHGGVSQGASQAAGSAAASFLPALAVKLPAALQAAKLEQPVSPKVRAASALASVLGATGAAAYGNYRRDKSD